MTRQADDPRLRALAELVHQLRPAWNRAGIIAALHASTDKPLDQLIRAALDAAFDPDAATPAVIQHRDGGAWAATPTGGKPTVSVIETGKVCSRCSTVHVRLDDGTWEPCRRIDPSIAERGMVTARAALADAVRDLKASP